MLVTGPSIQGTPDEISIYSNESYYVGGCRLRRHSLRTDGFVSVHAPYGGGELVTRPLVFKGRELVLNYSTSAAGSVKVEITKGDGAALPDYRLEKCQEIYGDEIEGVVRWESGSDVGGLAGEPVRLRIVLSDADLYALRFR
jgi:hypothetical protein